jgi:8-amino-7-oxononanoate synthase
MPALETFLEEELDILQRENLLRTPKTALRTEGVYVEVNGKKLLSFSCNDYLGLASHPEVIQAAHAALDMYGMGAGASRLITGNSPLYDALEAALCDVKHTEAACVFGSGYLANIGTIPALCGAEDIILADKHVHACIVDGMKLSDARFLRFKHNDVDDLKEKLSKHRSKYKKCLIITETIFSMDGDISPLREIKQLAKEHDATLMTDDAHGLGVMHSEAADIQMGTLSKAAGGYGGYVCASKEVVRLLKSLFIRSFKLCFKVHTRF